MNTNATSNATGATTTNANPTGIGIGICAAPVSNANIMKKYQVMLRAGVPVQAVTAKMELEVSYFDVYFIVFFFHYIYGIC